MQSPGAKEVVPATMADGSVRVVALKGNEPVGAWEFEKDAVTIGRSKTADVRLDDAAISRVHCTISVRPAGVFIVDNGSRNGIWLNGRRVVEAMLSSRDEVVVERFRIKAYMVWGQNTAANKFADRVDEKTNATAPMAAAKAAAIPASQLKTEIPRGKAVLAKPAAIAPVAPARIPAPPSLEATNAMPELQVPKAAATRGVTSEFEDILADIRPAKPAARKAAPAPVVKSKPAAAPVVVAEESIEVQAPAPKPVVKAPAKQPIARATIEKKAVKAAPTPVFFDEFDDEEEEDTTPAFSMIEVLASARAGKPLEGKGVIEVIRYRGMNVLEVARIDRGGEYCIPFTQVPLLTFGAADSAQIDVQDGMAAELRKGSTAKQVSGPVALRYGEVLDVQIDDVGYLVRFAEPKEPKRNGTSQIPVAAIAGATGGAVGLHLIVLVAYTVVGLLTPEKPEFGEFATIEMNEPEPEVLAEATPAPTPEPVKEPEPKIKQPKTPPERLAKRPQQNAPVGGADRTEAKVASAGVLGGLGKMDLKIESSSSALAAVTNLDAVRSTSGKSGGFKVSALSGKVPGDAMLGRAGRANGTVAVTTLNSKDLLANAKGGYGGIAKQGGGKVRGVVERTPTANVGVQGSLDRAQIAAVVNKHIQEIRHCYEKNLINDPSLSGKIQVEWTINPNGTVAAVKTKFSSLKGGDVTGCIAGRIRTWQFPRPKGNGYVIVNYPFMFDSVGF